MSTLWQNLQYKVLRSGSKLNLLIGINVIVFLLINIADTLGKFFFKTGIIEYYSTEYLLLPSNLSKLLTHFWTPITYMFMHAGIFHILFNMLWLYWFGQIFEEYLGKKRTLGLYIMGGLAGAFLFVLCYNTVPLFANESAPLVGASASVMAIIIGTATLLPNYTISLILIGPVKLKWIALFIIIIDFFGIVGPNAGGEIAHLGGVLMGFVYIKQVQKGSDWIAGIANLFKAKSKLKVVSKNSSGKSGGKPRQEEIDLILDKISQSGYDSLNKQEKEILFRASNNEG
ncbi:rhomboid family intramembrane serine protease [Mucilaginibacter sp.]|uniref:rhomboid family intramembrane serine protease n=1 Tax=Mucilaginibacter sp. TaxID=1882438 RepID=UPI0026317C01|nr:rhomboid family intramembrane serine protease [Mucilaginibacter sp.]MDB4920986.1 rhomboid family intrarane serine protease [Mucilaginibacter sp.]